jgi:NAD-dependent deacetylase
MLPFFPLQERDRLMNLPIRNTVEKLIETRKTNKCYKRTAREILDRGRIVALTGAGISVDSGIPDFRDPGGLWERFDPMEYAHIDAFMRNPEKTWRLIRELQQIVDRAEPNEGHRGLSHMEEMGLLASVITQNVDGLHQKAGNSDVIEYHGNNRFLVCVHCHKRYDVHAVSRDAEGAAPRCECGAVLKPDFVLFGEAIPQEPQFRAQVAARQCGVMLVVGTSATVYPASQIPETAKNSGALIIEINVRRTHLTGVVTDIFLEGSASEVFPRLVSAVRALQ